MLINKTSIKILTGNNTALLSTSMLLLRCTIGIILFVVGSGKVLGWFGGFGMETTIKFFAQLGISIPLTYLSSYTEFIGGLLLTIGLLTRPAAFAVMINMLVATILTLPNEFLAQNGASFPFIFLIISITILLAGPMAYSVDSMLINSGNIIDNLQQRD